jgi:Rrf2 family transcriptional regulator, iron-sulfur cluster assembly transcription factor
MVSKKALHALNATVFIAHNATHQPVPTQEISRALGVSVSYLEGMLKQLKDHGILQSFRGPGGGYQMGHGLAETSVWDVVRIFDPAAEPEPRTAGAGDKISADYETQLSELVEEFLASKKIGGQFGGIPIHIPSNTQPTSAFKFKPLPPPLMPMCPNSVFQLSAFTQRAGRP